MGLLGIDPETEGCQRICDLPDDLLLWILLFVPTKVAVATAVLSKRWRYVWKMMIKLVFIDDQDSESYRWFIDKSVQLHKAPKLVTLIVELGPRFPVEVDVTKWVEKAVNHGVKKLDFKVLWTGEPTSLPKSLYTCDTLVYLTLSNQILVDVSFPASLPSLSLLDLSNVVYKDDESLARLLSSSPLLEDLYVERCGKDDNLTNFTVKVPSLKILSYETKWPEEEEWEEEGEWEEEWEYQIGSLVIDCPALTELSIMDNRGEYCSLIENNMLCLDEVYIDYVLNHAENFLRCLSSVRRLRLCLSESMVACCNAINFSRLVELVFFTEDPIYWLEPLICLLQNSPKLKSLKIKTTGCPPCSWNQPSTIPPCLTSHLEVVGWERYEGKEDTKQLMAYILANSNCLKKVEISLIDTCNLQEFQKELEAMPRISTSSRLLFSTFTSPVEIDWRF